MIVNRQNKHRAFTILELVMVIAVVGILCGILIPTFSHVLEKAAETSAYSDAMNVITCAAADTSVVDKDADILVFSKNKDEIYLYGYDRSEGQVYWHHTESFSYSVIKAQVTDEYDDSFYGVCNYILDTVLLAEGDEVVCTITDDNPAEVAGKRASHDENMAQYVASLRYDTENIALFSDFSIGTTFFAEESSDHNCEDFAAVLPAIAATCDKSGYSEGRYCTKCSNVLVARELTPVSEEHTSLGDAHPVEGHAGVHKRHCTTCGKDVYATCDFCANGHPSTGCSVCGYGKNASDYRVVTAAIPATCTTAGVTEGVTCALCGGVLEGKAATAVPASNHLYGTAVSNGNNTHSQACTRQGCGYVLTTACGVCANGHTSACSGCGFGANPSDYRISEENVLPTCSATGRTGRVYCNYCNTTFTDSASVPVVEHSYGAAVSLENGSHKSVCSVCGTEKIEACDFCEHGHSSVCSACGFGVDSSKYVKSVTVSEATCTEDGISRTFCKICNADLEQDVILPATNHSYVCISGVGDGPALAAEGHIVKCENCSDEQLVGHVCETDAHGICSVCGYANAVEETVNEVTPTCTQKGCSAGTRCAVCKETLSGMEELDYAHVYGTWTTITTGNYEEVLIGMQVITTYIDLHYAVENADESMSDYVDYVQTEVGIGMHYSECTLCGSKKIERCTHSDGGDNCTSADRLSEIQGRECKCGDNGLRASRSVDDQVNCRYKRQGYYCIFCSLNCDHDFEVSHTKSSNEVSATCTTDGHTGEYCLYCTYKGANYTVLSHTDVQESHSSSYETVVANGKTMTYCPICEEIVSIEKNTASVPAPENEPFYPSEYIVTCDMSFDRFGKEYDC